MSSGYDDWKIDQFSEGELKEEENKAKRKCLDIFGGFILVFIIHHLSADALTLILGHPSNLVMCAYTSSQLVMFPPYSLVSFPCTIIIHSTWFSRPCLLSSSPTESRYLLRS